LFLFLSGLLTPTFSTFLSVPFFLLCFLLSNGKGQESQTEYRPVYRRLDDDPCTRPNSDHPNPPRNPCCSRRSCTPAHRRG
jgi:hypothetical protein